MKATVVEVAAHQLFSIDSPRVVQRTHMWNLSCSNFHFAVDFLLLISHNEFALSVPRWQISRLKRYFLKSFFAYEIFNSQ
jgi:hypothetical protein